MTITNGWLNTAIAMPSPNYNKRPVTDDGSITDVRLIVIHNISLPPNQFNTGAIEAFFLNTLDCSQHPYFQQIKDLQVSSHLLIKRNGDVIQFVSFNDRAWHAGQSSYLGVANCNDYSIGIELEGTDNEPFTEVQYQQLALAIHAIQSYYPLTINALAGHSDIAPCRKTDPGPHFNWQKIRQTIKTH